MRVRAVLSVGTLLGFGTIGTTAYWTDDTTAQLGGLDSGEIHIDLFDAFRLKVDSHQWTGMSLANMLPGSSVANVVSVTNNSIGRVDLTYTVQGSATGAIAPHLQVTLLSGGTSNGTTCSGGAPVGAANTALSTTMTAIGSTDTALPPGQSDQLCVQVRLAPNAPSETQSQTSTATFVFTGTQAA